MHVVCVFQLIIEQITKNTRDKSHHSQSMDAAIARFLEAAAAFSQPSEYHGEAAALIDGFRRNPESYRVFIHVLQQPGVIPHARFLALDAIQYQIHQAFREPCDSLAELVPFLFNCLPQPFTEDSVTGKIINLIADIFVGSGIWPSFPDGFPSELYARFLSDIVILRESTYAIAYIDYCTRMDRFRISVERIFEFLAAWEVDGDISKMNRWIGLLDTTVSQLDSLDTVAPLRDQMSRVAGGVASAMRQAGENDSDTYQLVMQFASLLKSMLFENILEGSNEDGWMLVLEMVLPWMKGVGEWLFARDALDDFLDLIDPIGVAGGPFWDTVLRCGNVFPDLMCWLSEALKSVFERGNGKMRVTVIDVAARLFDSLLLYRDPEVVAHYLKWYVSFLVLVADKISWVYVFGNMIRTVMNQNRALACECLNEMFTVTPCPTAGIYLIVSALKELAPQELLGRCLETIFSTDPHVVPISGLRLALANANLVNPRSILINMLAGALDRVEPEQGSDPAFVHCVCYFTRLLQTAMGEIPGEVFQKIRVQMFESCLESNAKSAFEFTKQFWMVLSSLQDERSGQVLNDLIEAIAQAAQQVVRCFQERSIEVETRVAILATFLNLSADLPGDLCDNIFQNVYKIMEVAFTGREFLESFGPDGEVLLCTLAKGLIAIGATRGNVSAFGQWVARRLALCPVPGHFQVLDALIQVDQFEFLDQFREFYANYKSTEPEELTKAVIDHLDKIRTRLWVHGSNRCLYDAVSYQFFTACFLSISPEVHTCAISLIKELGRPRNDEYALGLFKALIGYFLSGRHTEIDEAARVMRKFLDERLGQRLRALLEDVSEKIPGSQRVIDCIVRVITEEDDDAECDASKIALWCLNLPVESVNQYFGI